MGLGIFYIYQSRFKIRLETLQITMNILKELFVSFYMYGCFASMYVCTTTTCNANGGQKRAPGTRVTDVC